MAKIYNVTREQAANVLGISTRTVDRYVKSGKLSYKKVSNKVLLAKEEIVEMKQDFTAMRQEVNTEIISWDAGTAKAVSNTDMSVKSSLEDSINEKIDKFLLVFKEKDNIIEEKNKVIFLLQKRIGELETKIETMVALPDYTQEKQEAILEKKKLQQVIDNLNKTVKTEKTKNIVLIAFFLALVGIVMFFFLNS